MKRRAPGCSGYIGDYTAQLYGEYSKLLKRIPIKQPVEWKVRVFFSLLMYQESYMYDDSEVILIIKDAQGMVYLPTFTP